MSRVVPLLRCPCMNPQKHSTARVAPIHDVSAVTHRARTRRDTPDTEGMLHRGEAEVTGLRRAIRVLAGFNVAKVLLDELDRVAERARSGHVADDVQRRVCREVPLPPELVQLLAVP